MAPVFEELPGCPAGPVGPVPLLPASPLCPAETATVATEIPTTPSANRATTPDILTVGLNHFDSHVPYVTYVTLKLNMSNSLVPFSFLITSAAVISSMSMLNLHAQAPNSALGNDQTGPTGDPGPSGNIRVGDTGATGPQGAAAVSAIGPTGPAGLTGATGPNGDILESVTGQTGPVGVAGPVGSPAGPTGPSGASMVPPYPTSAWTTGTVQLQSVAGIAPPYEGTYQSYNMGGVRTVTIEFLAIPYNVDTSQIFFVDPTIPNLLTTPLGTSVYTSQTAHFIFQPNEQLVASVDAADSRFYLWYQGPTDVLRPVSFSSVNSNGINTASVYFLFVSPV